MTLRDSGAGRFDAPAAGSLRCRGLGVEVRADSRDLSSGLLPERIGSLQGARASGCGRHGRSVSGSRREPVAPASRSSGCGPDRSAEELRRRFEVEARVTALLQHPSIIPVYDLFSDQGWLLLHHASGGGSEVWLSCWRRLRAGRSVSFRYGLLQGWSVCSCRWPTLWPTPTRVGSIHRDLKPSNIMIGPFEEVLVLDWGMAQDSGRRGGSAREGEVPRSTSFVVCARRRRRTP